MKIAFLLLMGFVLLVVVIAMAMEIKKLKTGKATEGHLLRQALTNVSQQNLHAALVEALPPKVEALPPQQCITLVDAPPQNHKKGFFGPKLIATKNEQWMFWRLTSAFAMPEYIVLTQVSFGALLTARGGASRYSFAQKRADFVLINKGFKVLAIIELDDASHKDREREDAERDSMLIEAGYKVLRYTNIPDVETLRSDLISKVKPEATAPVPLISKR